ncbi:MAG: sucrose-phosphate phosphatase [Chroococcales cyanobacterium]
MSAFLFITDLDHTLVGDDAALEKLNEQLGQHRQVYGTKIVYATGRSLTLYRQLTQEKPLLTPDALITAVGTEIYLNPNQDIFDSAWADKLALGWNREKIVAIAGEFSDLIPQPETEQNPFKVSYFISDQIASDLIPELESALKNQNLSIQLIYSGGKDLDILPQNSDKGLAIEYLRRKWNMESHNTVVCGDSGNDIALFSIPNKSGILVGNAQPELLQWYEENANDSLYLAKAACAGGILEGLYSFNLLPNP